MTAEACYLGLDTATPYLALALWSPGQAPVCVVEHVGRDHARRLVPELDGLLARVGVARRHLRGVVVGIGPGSYTGLRVGLATAQGLGRGLALPVQGVPTLEAMAAGVLSAELPEAVLALDARRDHVYAAPYRLTEAGLVPLGAIIKLPRAEVGARYGDLPIVEAVPPDPGYLARQALATRGPATALYM